jgi:hypothetical protein
MLCLPFALVVIAVSAIAANHAGGAADKPSFGQPGNDISQPRKASALMAERV